jgi:hypothetical protein
MLSLNTKIDFMLFKQTVMQNYTFVYSHFCARRHSRYTSAMTALSVTYSGTTSPLHFFRYQLSSNAALAMVRH